LGLRVKKKTSQPII